MDREPLVTILMNCFNGEKYQKEAIDSVIKQKYNNWELIFWDNQSTDNSNKIVKNYSDKRIKYFYAKNHTNLGEARKEALKKGNGELVAFLDVDDIWMENKLQEQIKYFADKKTGINYSNCLWFSNKNRRILYDKKVKHETSTKKHPQQDAKFKIKSIKKSGFQKTLHVLKPYDLLCRMHFAEGSPIKRAIKKVKEIHQQII